MRYGIALFPSKALQERVNSYRKRYDTHYAYIPPHITVKGAFELAENEVDDLVGKLKKATEGIDSIPIVVNKVRSFHPVNNVIYLKVDEHPALTELYERLNGPEFPNTESYHFVPHITIAQDLSDVEHVDIYERLQMTNIYHEETIHSFHLLYQDDQGVWKTLETFDLGGN